MNPSSTVKAGIARVTRLLLTLLLLTALLPCCTLLEAPPSAPLPGEDVGPKPDAHAFVARWANENYASSWGPKWTPQELILADPVPVAYNEPLMGRKVGWLIEIGPENRALVNCIGFPTTQLIVNRDRVVSMVSR
jgi:hypothetical protein